MKTIRFLLGILLSLFCLWLAVRNVHLGEVAGLLAHARYQFVALAVCAQLLACLARSKLWVVLLGNNVRLWDSFWSEGIGYLFTNILPFRMGDPARIFAMSRRSNLPLFRVAASAVVERLSDVTTVLLALIAVFPFMHVPAQAKQAGIAFGAVALTALLGMVLLVKFRRLGERVVHFICERISFLPTERILSIWRDLIGGIAIVSHPRIGLRAIVWSLINWSCGIGANWLILRAFKPDATLVEATFMLAAVCLAVTLPSSPGFIGIFQWVGQQALVLPFAARYDLTTALAITVTAHLVYYIPTTVLGVIGLSRFGTSLMTFRKSVETFSCSGS